MQRVPARPATGERRTGSRRHRAALALLVGTTAAGASSGPGQVAAAPSPPYWSQIQLSGAPQYGAIPELYSCSGDCGLDTGPQQTQEEYQTGAIASDTVDGTVLAYTQDSQCEFTFGMGGCSDVATTSSFDGSTWHVMGTERRGDVGSIAPASMSRDPMGTVRVEPCGTVECLYRWTGSAWDLQHPATSPPARDYANVAYNDRAGWLLLYGGWTAACTPAGCCLTDTWTWDGTAWSQDPGAAHPGCAVYQSMARDPVSGMVLYDPQTRSTWRHDGSGWHLLDPAHVPPLGSPGALSLTYDSASGVVVMTMAPEPKLKDRLSSGSTWTWDGTDWTNRAVADQEGPGAAPSAADPRTGRTVGISGSTTYVWSPLLG